MNFALLTDLYQFTMAQAYWKTGRANEQACFHAYFRKNPFEGGFAVACGQAQLAQALENYRFDDEALAFLSGLKDVQGKPLFEQAFLDYLGSLELELDIDALSEGSVVFPYEPILRVMGPVLQCQLVETLLLNIINFETLIATKAARVCLVAQAPVAEFGLRRAQGFSGGVWASRAAIVGGCSSTSNVLAAQQFNLPVSGTHAHSWVMAFDSELEAFRRLAEIYPQNLSLLVDTYDVVQGLEHAIVVGHELESKGGRLASIRIDSGDLAWAARMARKRLDEAGLYDTKIILSNDLDEFTIKSILEQRAPVDGWGVGTKLAVAYDQPSLGGVYKLSAVRSFEGDLWRDCLKVSEQSSKQSIPGVLGIRRYFDENGCFCGDMIYDLNYPVSEQQRIIDPMDMLHQKSLQGYKYQELLSAFMRQGRVVLEEDELDAQHSAKRAKQELERLDASVLRMLNPHVYPVGLEESLYWRRHGHLTALMAQRKAHG